MSDDERSARRPASPGSTELRLPAELTQAQATACLAELLGALGRATDATVVADAARLERFDSSALAVLLELRRACGVAGRRFSVRALPPRLRELAGLYGIDGLLDATPRAPTT